MPQPSTTHRRERLTDGRDAKDRRILDFLLAQDGSTTRLCEAIAGGQIELHVVYQQTTRAVPAFVRSHLPGELFIERVTFLAAHGEVFMDNLTFVALEYLPSGVKDDLLRGKVPVGHLLRHMWVRRERLEDVPELSQQLWKFEGLPDPEATRTYQILTREGPCMVITETFRRGMTLDFARPSSPLGASALSQ